MATTRTLDRNGRLNVNGDRLDAEVTRQVKAILESAADSQVPNQRDIGHWYLRMPSPGVRYYKF